MGREMLIAFRPRVGHDGRTDQGQVHDHHRRRDQSLVSQQPDVPRRDPRADVLRLRGGQRRRPGPLRGAGEARPRPSRGAAIALGKDWYPAARLQNAPSWHYVHSDQWRYEKSFTDYHTVPPKRSQDGPLTSGAHDGRPGAGGAQRLAAVLPAVQQELAGPGEGGGGGGAKMTTRRSSVPSSSSRSAS